MYKGILVLVIAALALPSCGGGGGGGGGFIGAALVNVKSSPNRIDTGDRTLITSEVDEIHENGILLKYKYPTGLTYVLGTAFIEVDGEEIDLDPAVNVSSSNTSYLIFSLKDNLFGENRNGTLSFELQGVAGVNDGEIAIDADLIDDAGGVTVQFDVENPDFQEEDTASIAVEE